MSDGIDPTLVALARWQGETDRALQENHRRLEKVSNSVDGLKRQVGELSSEIAALKVSVRFWSGLAAMVGASIATYVGGKLG